MSAYTSAYAQVKTSLYWERLCWVAFLYIFKSFDSVQNNGVLAKWSNPWTVGYPICEIAFMVVFLIKHRGWLFGEFIPHYCRYNIKTGFPHGKCSAWSTASVDHVCRNLKVEAATKETIDLTLHSYGVRNAGFTAIIDNGFPKQPPSVFYWKDKYGALQWILCLISDCRVALW